MICRPGPRLIRLRPLAGLGGIAMELFTQLFGDLLAFVYHCFDRIVIYGYLSGLSRPEQVVHFFPQVVGVPVVSKEVLSQRTADYQAWVEAFARNHRLPIEWAEKGVRKEDHVVPWQRRMARKRAYGVYYIFKSMEQGPTFRVSVPKYPTKDPHHRILASQRSRFTHYYFYIRDETLGPMVMRVASFFPFQTTYYLNGHSFIALRTPFSAHSIGSPMIAGEGFHPGLVVVGPLAQNLLADHRNADHLTEEVHDLLRTRETAEVAVNDNAVEAVVDEGEQVAEQLSEQFHGNPRTARSGSKNYQARSGQADRRGQEFSSRRRGALYSAPRRRLRQPHRHRRSADPVLHQNRRCLAARPRRAVRRKAGSTGRERAYPHRGD